VRKLIVSEFVSLDGVIEDPGWTFQFESEEKDQFKFDELAASDALLLGRVTYEGFAAAWPQMEEQTGDYGAWMNSYPKYVVSGEHAPGTRPRRRVQVHDLPRRRG
jgi:dihydrofolate reductase